MTATKAGGKKEPLNNVKVLVVDDNEDFLKALSGSLRNEGIECVDVTSGAGAIEAVKRESFDLIFLDVVMDEMDGLVTYRKIKELGVNCPIIFMSAYYENYKNEIEGLNPYAVLRKPFDIEQFLSYISKPPQ